jgi:hypothetical protein
MLSEGNSALVLRAVMLTWWIETELQNRFSVTMLNGILDFRVRMPVGWIFGLERKMDYGRKDRWVPGMLNTKIVSHEGSNTVLTQLHFLGKFTV